MLACKDEHVGNSWLPYTDEQQKHEQKWINPMKHERGVAPFTEVSFINKLCQHCKDAPCEKAAPDVISRRGDGAVMLDAEKARGSKHLLDACPYGMISWNAQREVAQKCTMCTHLLDDGWKEPRCVQACPLRALSMVSCTEDEAAELIKAQQLMPLTDGANFPRVLYSNLHRFNTCFIAGALAYRDGDVEKTADKAVVRLFKDGQILAETSADFFGEFKIDRIPKNSGTYELVCKFDGYKEIRCEITVSEDSPCLDVMYFGK